MIFFSCSSHDAFIMDIIVTFNCRKMPQRKRKIPKESRSYAFVSLHRGHHKFIELS